MDTNGRQTLIAAARMRRDEQRAVADLARWGGCALQRQGAVQWVMEVLRWTRASTTNMTGAEAGYKPREPFMRNFGVWRELYFFLLLSPVALATVTTAPVTAS
jgi:hypothetical protein